ncbi:ribonuclease III [Candidatus Gottesmanbacteria bacterium]|nr:ribonuclease III [Candidatus Gottesmanbacteria bacterium]
MTFEALQKTISVTFADQELLKQAFIHRSYLNEARSIKESNERLEFLGDAILSFLTSQFLYKTYPLYPEGKLTNIRSSLVNTKSLGTASASLSLGDLLFLSKGEQESGGRTNQSLLADCFEALLGALYLDQGIVAAQNFLEKHLFPNTEEIISNKKYVDFKSHLQEVIQEKTRVSPTYVVIKSEGPDHAKTFWVEVRAEERLLGSGEGKSKQEAEQNAASDALSALEKLSAS